MPAVPNSHLLSLGLSQSSWLTAASALSCTFADVPDNVGFLHLPIYTSIDYALHVPSRWFCNAYFEDSMQFTKPDPLLSPVDSLSLFLSQLNPPPTDPRQFPQQICKKNVATKCAEYGYPGVAVWFPSTLTQQLNWNTQILPSPAQPAAGKAITVHVLS